MVHAMATQQHLTNRCRFDLFDGLKTCSKLKALSQPNGSEPALGGPLWIKAE
jgi:hypothetical protein